MKFFSDTKHLWILLALLVLAGVGAWEGRSRLMPETYGDRMGRYGPYRAAALEQIASRPSVLITDSVCHECHQDVKEERAESKHATVLCIHCHGSAREHVAQARAAAKSADAKIAPATEWDGDHLTKIDLYITQDRATCLVCHESTVGMPEWFQKIDVAEHLEEQGADEPDSKETCFECHGGHDTEP